MKLLSLNCNNCGGPLEVAEDTRFVTCGRCGSQLTVEHAGSAAFTRRIFELEQRTDELEQEVGAVRLQNELEQLERDWLNRQQRLASEGEAAGSSPWWHSWQAVVAVGIGGLGVLLLKLESESTFIVGVALVLVALPFAALALAKSRDVSGDELVYRTRRRALMAQLQATRHRNHTSSRR